jgi:hypothetical protein
MAALTFLASWQELLRDKTPIRRLKKRPSTTKRRASSLNQKSVRKEVKDHHVLQLIVSLTIPQIIIQSIALTKFPAQVEIIEGDSLSWVACQSDHWWPTLISVILVIVLFLMAVFVAYICRDLPSLFNEKAQIFKASWINFMVLVFAGTMVGLTDSETTSPNSRAFLWTFVTLCVALTPCFYIVFPKVNRARKGEMVVLSRLFASSSSSLGAPSGAVTTTASQPGSGSSRSPLGNSSNNFVPSHVDPLTASPLSKIVVHENDPPPRHLEVQLFAMKDLITTVGDSSTEGRRISKHEWLLLQNSTLALSNHLQQLEFDWEEQDDGLLRRKAQAARESLADIFSAVEY